LERVENPSEIDFGEEQPNADASAENAVITNADSAEPTPTEVGNERQPRPRIPHLASKQINIRMNQKGVTWKGMLGDYFKTAKKIVVTDPFVRLPHQVSNFIELIQAIQDSSLTPEELKIELHTQTSDDEQAATVIDYFQDLQEDLAPRGIEFSWFFDAVHDRSIVLDNGWTINLGRGLDIYERYSRWSLCASRPENRSCKEFSISIIQD
jgi:ATP-dependent Lon protease